MNEEKPRKRRATKFVRSARRKRIPERLRDDFGHDWIAPQENLTERRVRQIVAEALVGPASRSRTPSTPGEGARNISRKSLISLDSEKEMQGYPNGFSLFSAQETASRSVAARF